jgi:ATP synthase protein I
MREMDDRDEGLEERRRRLTAELASKRAEGVAEAAREAQSGVSRKGMAQGLKISSEFIAAIAVGAMLGYIFDRFVGTAPWGMIVFLLLGFCAGVLSVLRGIGMVAPAPSEQSNLRDEGPDARH